MSTITTRSGKGSPLTHAEVDANFNNLNTDKYQSGDSPSFAGLTTTDNINFGDNDRAIFGAGSDLQIYHNGANSYIDDTGTGNLYIRGSDTVRLQSATGEQGVIVTTDGAVTLYHDNGSKLATTATGIDVTGTVTADGLTVDTNTLYVDSTNNRVGIGTSSPTEPLDVVGTIKSNVSSTGDFNFRATSTGGGQYLIYPDDATTANPTWLHQTNSSEDQAFVIGGVERVRIDSSGNVGIGTTSAAGKLHVVGGRSYFASNSDKFAVYLRYNNTTSGFFIGSPSADAMAFSASSGAERMRIDSSGNVGIGTSSPAGDFKLSIAGDNTIIPGINALNGSVVFSAYAISSAGVVATRSNHPLLFNTNSAERMRITSAGNVGIGTNSPSSTLELNVSSGNLELKLNGATATHGIRNQSDGSFGHYDYTNSRWLDLRNYASDYYTLFTAGAERMRIDSAGNVGIGLTNPLYPLSVSTTSGTIARFAAVTNTAAFEINSPIANYIALKAMATDGLIFSTNNDEKMRIDTNGNLLVGTTSLSITDAGVVIQPAGSSSFTVSGDEILNLNRLASDGVLVRFYQDSTSEGSISVSGTTVSYNGGHLARWSQLADNTRDETILKGTVMTNLDQMAEWATDGVTEDNEQLNCMAVSSVEGDPNVAGVFVNWDNDDDVYTNDMNIAMTGDMIIRIAADTTIARGNLLMSAGDGTAKPQGDDIVRSKTIAKVTSTYVTCTYDDGSYCVPCVLMAC